VSGLLRGMTIGLLIEAVVIAFVVFVLIVVASAS
jgi:hypothetical protein